MALTASEAPPPSMTTRASTTGWNKVRHHPSNNCSTKQVFLCFGELWYWTEIMPLGSARSVIEQGIGCHCCCQLLPQKVSELFQNKDSRQPACAGGNTDPMTGVKLVNPVILRPNLALQREIAAWCREYGVPYTPRQWTKDSGKTKTSSKRSCSRQLLAAGRAVGKFLVSRSPNHPFESYQYATK